MHFFLRPHNSTVMDACTHTHTHTHTHTLNGCSGLWCPKIVGWLILLTSLCPQNLLTHTEIHPLTICFGVTKLKMRLPESRNVCVCVCMCVCVQRDNTIFRLPQVVCSRRSWWLILPALSGVFRPPHQQVRDEGLHLTRTNGRYFISCPPFFLMNNTCAFEVIYPQIKEDS